MRGGSALQKPASAIAPDADCHTCDGTGWEFVGAKGVRKCHCLVAATKRVKLAAIPPKFAGLTLATIKPDTARHPDQAELLATMRSEPRASYILCGRNGCGKTQLGWVLYREAVEAGRMAYASPLTDLLEQYKAWLFDSDKLPGITPAEIESDDRFVFLDEIDKARPTEFAAETLFRLVDKIYSYQRQLVITSNTPLDELAGLWARNSCTMGPSIVRRLCEMQDAMIVDLF